MADYKPEEAGLLLMSVAKILIMDHEPKDVAATVQEEHKVYATAGVAGLIAWLGDFITYLVLEDEPEEEIADA